MKILKTILLMTAMCSFTAAQDFNPAFSRDEGDSLSIPVPAATPAAEPVRAVKEWTVMAFINGKNNLEPAALADVNIMEKFGSDKNVNIVVQLGRMKGQTGDSTADGDWTGMKRFFVTKDDGMDAIKSAVVGQAAQCDMGDYKSAVDFVKWAKANYPAKRYVFILWNHGLGFMDPKKAEAAKEDKGISFDDETGNYIRTKQIADILKEAGKVDVLSFNACLMQMAEVTAEIKPYAEVVVGSEEVSYAPFFNAWIEALEETPKMSNEQLGTAMVTYYIAIYKQMAASNPKMNGVALSAIRTSKIDAFNVLAGDFARLAVETNDIEALKKARKDVLRFDVLMTQDPKKEISFFGDIYQFADILSSNLTKTDEKALALKAKADELKKFIKEQLVIYKDSTGKDRLGTDLSGANGIAVYLPPVNTAIQQVKLEGIFEAPYSTFEFDKATKWHDFVTFIYNNAK